MAALRRRLAAQQDYRLLEQGAVEPGFDLTLAHQRHKPRLVLLPRQLLATIAIQDLRGRRQHRLVQIFRRANFLEEEGEISALGKARQLRNVVQANIEQKPYPGRSQV